MDARVYYIELPTSRSQGKERIESRKDYAVKEERKKC
jgi:hypothetical protein